MPMSPVVRSNETISYQCARYLATVLSPLIGKTQHHVRNSKDFAREVVNLSLHTISQCYRPGGQAFLVIKKKTGK